jgi:hypothetical protein
MNALEKQLKSSKDRLQVVVDCMPALSDTRACRAGKQHSSLPFLKTRGKLILISFPLKLQMYQNCLPS